MVFFLAFHARIQEILPVARVPGPTARKQLTFFLVFFFSPQLILQFYSGLSMGFFQRGDPTFSRGDPTFSRGGGGGGSKC